MGDHSPPTKPDEQYPLLKIDGSGDINHVKPAQTVTPGWGVTCTKKSRFSRWPEFISACWMTLILCGVSFLVFHALGMGFHRRQQFIIMKCNSSKPASNVYYHHIVQRGSQVPFVLYTEYLSNMATQYPMLHFNVVFLIDDFDPDATRASKRHFIPVSQSWFYNYKLDEIGKEAYNELTRKYQNINVSIIPLNKYMAMTPLKFKWRLIPQAHLSFYIRVLSVWQNGGIGIDLGTYNNHHHNNQYTDSRIDAILRQHNDGINTAEYTKALSKIDNDEATADFNMFIGFIKNFLSESFFNKTLSFFPVFNEKRNIGRSRRSNHQTNPSENIKTGPINDPKDFYDVDNNVPNLFPRNFTMNKNLTGDASRNITTELKKQSSNSTEINNSEIKNSKYNGNGSDTHQVVLFYDFSFMSDNTDPSVPTFFIHKPSAASKMTPQLLSMDVEGTFIAASSKLHPFLGRLISSGCFGITPSFVIHNALLTHCSGVFKVDVYCNNIYIL